MQMQPPISCALTGRIPSLDGLRAISIIAVTVSHMVPRADPNVPRWTDFLRKLGSAGVDFFFVISGFLITHLLIREWKATGGVSLKAFYARRALRILPAFWLLLAGLFAMTRFGVLEITTEGWIRALTYTVNLTPTYFRGLGHLWSLSVEEHFYLLWPVTFILLGPRRAIYPLLAVLVLCPVLRYLIWITSEAEYVEVGTFTLTRLDTIGVGCLLALGMERARFRERIEWVGRRANYLMPLAWLLLALAIFGIHSGKYYLLISRGLNASLMASIVVMSTQAPDSSWGRFLNWRPMTAIGLLSYSLYLWQPLLMLPEPCHLSIVPATLALIGAALVSHFCVEKPFLSLRGRLRWRAPSSMMPRLRWKMNRA